MHMPSLEHESLAEFFRTVPELVARALRAMLGVEGGPCEPIQPASPRQSPSSIARIWSCVITQYKSIDYVRTLREAKLIVDTRDALRSADGEGGNVVKP